MLFLLRPDIATRITTMTSSPSLRRRKPANGEGLIRRRSSMREGRSAFLETVLGDT